jgi:peptidoglycan/LPS O-acetylase OafA/YrhL
MAAGTLNRMKPPLRNIQLLDYVRGIAILAVLLDHVVKSVYGYEVLPWDGIFRSFSVPTSFLWLLPFSLGTAGVAIFFVVSGFCIHLSFEQQGRQWGGFFIRRLFRIYPAYLAVLIFFTLFFMETAQFHIQNNHVHLGLGLQVPQPEGWFWGELLTHIFLVHNAHPDTFYGITGALWSLAIEAQLYLLYPVFRRIVGKFGWRRAILLLAAVEFAIRAADGVVQCLDGGNTTAGTIVAALTRSPFSYWFSWAIGAWIADAFLKDEPLPFRNLRLIWWPGLIVLSYLIKPFYPFWFPLFAVLTALIISKRLSPSRREITFPAFLPNALAKLGLWSYSLYLLHQLLLGIYTDAVTWFVPERFRTGPGSILTVALPWLAILPLSVLWYKVLELPGIAVGKRLIQKNRPQDGAGLQHHLVVNHWTRHIPKIRYAAMAATLVLIGGVTLFINATVIAGQAPACNNLAWSLATNPDASHRNGSLAVKLAERACTLTHYKQTLMIGTLAAAYAEAGQFDNAISTAQKACQLASESGNQQLLQKNQELLALYVNHQPFHQSGTVTNQ